jgi:hypothetical protein
MNETIAIFDGWDFHKGDPNHKCPYCIGGDEPCTAAVDRFVKNNRTVFHYQLKYQSSWDALIPVVEKIPKLIRAELELEVRRQMSARYKPIENELCNFNRVNVHYCLYQFIVWYNNKKRTNE